MQPFAAMAAVLALTVVPVILLAILAIGSAANAPSATAFLTAGFFVAVLFGAVLGLFMWARSVDHSETHAEG